MDTVVTANLIRKRGRNFLVLMSPDVHRTLFLFLTVLSPSRVKTTLTDTWRYGQQPSSGLCADGDRQSPIDIALEDVVVDQNASVTLQNYDTFVPTNTKAVSFDHDTVTFFADVDSPASYLIVDDGDKSTAIFVLHSLLFHWGNTEHHFRDLPHANLRLEAHLVHYRRDFGSVKEAMNHVNGLSVLAVLFELKPDAEGPNPALDAIVSVASGKGGNNVSVKWSDLLPSVSLNYSVYQYSGSITRQPCVETVIWHVLAPPNIGSLTASQLEWFQRSRGGDHPKIVSNSRNLQPLNDREIRQVRLAMTDTLSLLAPILQKRLATSGNESKTDAVVTNKAPSAAYSNSESSFMAEPTLPNKAPSAAYSNSESSFMAEPTLPNKAPSATYSNSESSFMAEPTLPAYLFSYIPIVIMVSLLIMFWYFYRGRTAAVEPRRE